jgi:hypothetical protein
VPSGSSQVAIDTREAYYAYGFGMAGMVTPWNNEAFLYRRDALSGTQITISRAIHVPETRFLGMDVMSGSNMIMRVAMSSNAEASLGFASTDSNDAHRDTLTELAYRHWEQNDYFWPDAHHDSFDKRNVRDGHYPLWSYEHAVIRTAGGAAVSQIGQRLANILARRAEVPSIDVTQLTVQTNLVPLCAMQVLRTNDGGDFTLIEPADPCGCYFDATVPHGSTTCMACPAGTCPTGQVCRHGYCEAH